MNGMKVPQENVVEYLGTLLQIRANPRPEILKRTSGAAFVRKSWTHSGKSWYGEKKQTANVRRDSQC